MKYENMLYSSQKVICPYLSSYQFVVMLIQVITTDITIYINLNAKRCESVGTYHHGFALCASAPGMKINNELVRTPYELTPPEFVSVRIGSLFCFIGLKNKQSIR